MLSNEKRGFSDINEDTVAQMTNPIVYADIFKIGDA